ncbi:gla-1 [Symbiodinium sp. CCMP2592]|nr:gla-1 [Symbiodinium sp. CCMP2592]
MPRQVSFSVKCADTRVGLHVRVVGSIGALGSWDTHKGLVLHTSASDFPVWKQTDILPLEEGAVVEYKYVICDNNGRGVRWEERVNRAVHIADLVKRDVVPPTGGVSIIENFVAYDPDELRFRSAKGAFGDRRSSSSRLQSKLSGEGSQIFPEGSTGGLQTTASLSDLLAPTIRERRPSKVALDCLGGYRRDSASNLGELADGGYAGAPECVSEPWVPSPQASSTGAGGDNIMVREESCSNLFSDLVDTEENIPDKSDFENKYALVGNGPLGEGTFGLVWRCTLKSGSGPHKEMAAKIVRKGRLQPRDMKYLLGDDGEATTVAAPFGSSMTLPESIPLSRACHWLQANHACASGHSKPMAENIVFAPPRLLELGREEADHDLQPSFRSLSVTALPLQAQGAAPGDSDSGGVADVAAALEKREQEIARRLAALKAASQDGDSPSGLQEIPGISSGQVAVQWARDLRGARMLSAPVTQSQATATSDFPAFAAPRLRQEKVDWEVPQSILDRLALAYDEDPQSVRRTPQQSRFAWTGVMDAARAAWIGGTQLLQYGELLPAGTEKALALMAPGLHFLPQGMPGRNHEVALELGMGRGRVGLHLFLAGATVLGVELAWQRFSLAADASERLSHRCPDLFNMSFLDAKFRLLRVGGPPHAFLEARHGDFLKLVTPEEVSAATLIFLHVCLPAASWPSLRQFLQLCQPGCRVLSYEDLRNIWKGQKDDFPFQDIATPALACSWAAEAGHRFYCYQRRDLNEEAMPLVWNWLMQELAEKSDVPMCRVKLHLTMKHPHICELLEYFDESSTVTLILEYCRGGDLFDAIVAQSKAFAFQLSVSPVLHIFTSPGQTTGRRRAAAAAEARLGQSPAANGTKGQPQQESVSAETDPRAADLMPAFDRAHAAAVARHKNTGEDAHHAPALRKAKRAVQESLERGDNLTLSSLHMLKGVGHWVVGQLRGHLTAGPERDAPPAKKRKAEAAPTPNSFTWWYISRAGERVETRNDAEMTGPPGGEVFRVSILHASGRMEKAWLPDAKAPAKSPHG